MTFTSTWGNRLDNNPHVISGCNDGTIKAWDVRSGECIATLVGHTDSITCFCNAKIGRDTLLVSGSNDTTIKVWVLEDDTEPEITEAKSQSLNCLRQSMESHVDGISSLDLFLHQVPRLVSCSKDTIKMWVLDSGECLRTCSTLDHSPTCLQIAPGGCIFTGGSDFKLKRWRMDTGRCSGSMEGHTECVVGLKLVEDKQASSSKKTIMKYALSAGRDCTVRKWCLERLCQLQVIETCHTAPITSLTLVQSGARDTFVTTSEDRTVKVWYADPGLCAMTLEGHIGATTSATVVPVTPSSSIIASASQDRTMKFWDLASGEQILGLCDSFSSMYAST
jgi:WD40 repeat protein